jgi:glycosyltransferase involved in cell wall biosynthesis
MNSTKPKISVIVPIYNVASFLNQCIESILNQSFQDFELILVNDGSLDESYQICLNYQKIDQRVIIVNKQNGGLLSARKAGFEVSTGNYIAFVDGDDWVDGDFLLAMYRLMEINKVDLVVTGHIREFEGKTEKILPYLKIGKYYGKAFNDVLDIMLFNGVFCKHGISTYVWNKLFKRENLQVILFDISNEITMGEDAAITYSYIANSQSLVISNNCHYYYRQRANSIVKTIQPIKVELNQLGKLFNHLYKSIGKKSNQDKLQKDLTYYLYSQILVRTGGFVNSKQIQLNPFIGLNNLDRTLVYSSGSFGQRLISFNKKQNNFLLKKWVDFDYEESRSVGLEVDSVFSLEDTDFDSVLIASIDLSQFESIVSKLELFGINASKVRKLNLDFSFVEKYIKELGYQDDFIFKINENINEF